MSGALAIGVLAALGAAACYDTGYALQALEARRAPARHTQRPSLIGHLARRRLWLAATALVVAGWPLQLFALSQAPLTVVQPVLALGLLLLLALGVRILGEHVGRREVAAVVAIVAGVGVMVAAAPAHSDQHATGAGLIGVLAGLGAIVLVPFAVRGRAPVWLLVAAAGAGDAWAAFAAKLITDALAASDWLAALGWALGTGAAVLGGLVSEMSALQRAPATRVGPADLVMQISIPVICAPLVGGESWADTPGGGALLAAALVLLAAGVAVLAGSRAVGGLLGGDR